MRALSVLYDETCGFCVSCARWLGAQRTWVGLECLPAGGEAAARRFPELRRSASKEELVVVDDEGGVYRDTHAWLMVLWALEDYRAWAQRLSRPALMPLAPTSHCSASTCGAAERPSLFASMSSRST